MSMHEKNAFQKKESDKSWFEYPNTESDFRVGGKPKEI
jgi:hypothetical protein